MLPEHAGSEAPYLKRTDYCTWVQDTALNHAEQLFAEGDVNGDGTLNCEEVIALMLKVSTPLAFCLTSGHLWLPSACLLIAFGCLLLATLLPDSC